MPNLKMEVAAHLAGWQKIKKDSPDLPSDDQTFIDTLAGESSLDRAIGSTVRDYRRESILKSAIEALIADLTEKRDLAEKREAEAWIAIETALRDVEEGTGETPVFQGPSYSLTLNEMGFMIFTDVGKQKPPLTGLPAAKKVEALFLQKIEAEASIQQIKAEKSLLTERQSGLLSTIERVKQDIADILPSLFRDGEKSVQLACGTITMKDKKRGLVVTDYDVVDPQYLLPPAPPPPREIDAEKAIRVLNSGKNLLGLKLDNGGYTLAFRVK